MVKVRAGIIGAGKVAQYHARALRQVPEVDFIAVCDKEELRAREFATRYGVSPYTDVDNMLRKERLHALIVCTPHPTHKQITLAAAAHSAHVLVEKPMAASLIDCDEMISSVYEAGVKLAIMSQRRFYAPVQRVKDAIEAGKIGKPILGEALVLGWRGDDYYQSGPWRGKWLAEGGGVLVNQAVHQLDILQWFMGPIQELFGYWGNFNHPEIEVDDSAAAVMRFKNGAIGSILFSNSVKPGLYGKVHIHGDLGASIGVQTDGGSMFIAGMSEVQEAPYNDIWTVPGEAGKLAQWQKKDRQFFESIHPIQHYHTLQVQDFFQAILDDREPMVTGEEGRKTVEIFTALYRSQRDRKPVIFPLDAQLGSEGFDGRLQKTARISPLENLMSNKIPAAILIMGVSGSGKSTVGKKLAEILSWSFIDGDDYHSPENITKMRGGIPLTDSDRAGWLRDLHELLRQHVEENTPVILACSALKGVYREKLGAGIPGLKIVYLRGDFK
jgi:predicted dehydrogenase